MQSLVFVKLGFVDLNAGLNLPAIHGFHGRDLKASARFSTFHRFSVAFGKPLRSTVVRRLEPIFVVPFSEGMEGLHCLPLTTKYSLQCIQARCTRWLDTRTSCSRHFQLFQVFIVKIYVGKPCLCKSLMQGTLGELLCKVGGLRLCAAKRSF